jgi:Zn-dependent protease with chaperone function
VRPLKTGGYLWFFRHALQELGTLNLGGVGGLYFLELVVITALAPNWYHAFLCAAGVNLVIGGIMEGVVKRWAPHCRYEMDAFLLPWELDRYLRFILSEASAAEVRVRISPHAGPVQAACVEKEGGYTIYVGPDIVKAGSLTFLGVTLHELGHIVSAHSLRKKGMRRMLQMAVPFAILAAWPWKGSHLLLWLLCHGVRIVEAAIKAKVSRCHELEADRFVAYLGYGAYLAALLRASDHTFGRRTAPSPFDSHPLRSERVKRLEAGETQPFLLPDSSPSAL